MKVIMHGADNLVKLMFATSWFFHYIAFIANYRGSLDFAKSHYDFLVFCGLFFL